MPVFKIFAYLKCEIFVCMKLYSPFYCYVEVQSEIAQAVAFVQPMFSRIDRQGSISILYSVSTIYFGELDHSEFAQHKSKA